MLIVAIVLVATLGEYVSAYRLYSDDFALVRHSSADAVAVQGVGPWFTSGYSEYFDNYPGWPRNETPFVRPLVNLQFYSASLLTDALGESVYLVPNYKWCC